MAASTWTSTPARALDFLSDERLARLAARGDQRAFGALFERHHAALTRYCRTVLRHAADAEDAAQNAMVAALRALESGAVPLRVKPWLYKIAHNEAVTLVRSRKPAEELDESRLPTVADAEEAGEVRRRLGQLMADLQALTGRQREALVLRELCGMGYAEIALTLHTSEAAAQQTVFEARSALAQFGEGRNLDCEVVQRAMSECDGMRLRTRKVRAHVRSCQCCASFEASLLARRRDLGLLFPPTGAACGIIAALGRLLGGGGGEPLLAGLGLKGAVVGIAVLAGGGAVVATSVAGRGPVSPAASVSAPVAALSGGEHRDGSATTTTAASAARGSDLAAGPSRRAAERRPQRGPGRQRPDADGATPAGPDDAAPKTGAAARESASSSVTGATHASSGQPDPGTTQSLDRSMRLPRLQDLTEQVATGVGEAVAGLAQSASDAVQNTVNQVGATAGGAVETVNNKTEETVDTVTDAVDAPPKLP